MHRSHADKTGKTALQHAQRGGRVRAKSLALLSMMSSNKISKKQKSQIELLAVLRLQHASLGMLAKTKRKRQAAIEMKEHGHGEDATAKFKKAATLTKHALAAAKSTASEVFW